MYELEITKEMYRDTPWKKPYQDRIEILKQAQRQGRRSVAFLYPTFDSSTFRYRGYNVAETLEYSLWWSGAYFQMEDLEELLGDLKYIDILIIIRCHWNPDFEAFIKEVQRQEITVCYDVDDLIYHPKYIRDLMEALGINNEFEWNFWISVMEKNRRIVEMCDAMIATNEYLAQFLRDDFNKPCYIIPNYLNWIQEEVSTEYFDEKKNKESLLPFIIGYFSGSPTHVKDLMMVMPEIEEFLNLHEDAILQIVGFMDLPEEYSSLIEKNRIKFVPFQSFAGLQYEQAKVDVNIVPLVNNRFSNCKSELKYFETAIVGTVTCATPSYTYAHAIRHGDNGYLCEVGEWLPALEEIYRLDEKKRKELQFHVREEALKVYSGKLQVGLVESVLNKIIEE